MGTGKAFRKLLETEKCVVLPGAYDSLSACIIEKMGFSAIDVSGLGIAAARMGQPDLGLASASEVIDQAFNIASSVEIPVIFDADTGYGGLMNVARTVMSFEKAGVAGIHIEDQMMPKKCGNLSGKQLVSMEEMVSKIKVAKEVLSDKDFVIIARSDSKALGADEVKRRLDAYLEAGADLAMLGDDYKPEELRKIASNFKGRLYLVAGVYAGEEMCLSVSEYAEMGIKALSFPIIGFLAAAKAIRASYEPLLAEGHISVQRHLEMCMPLKEVNELVKMDKWMSLGSM